MTFIPGLLASPPLPHSAVAGPEQPDQLQRPAHEGHPHAGHRRVRLEDLPHASQRFGAVRVPGVGSQSHFQDNQARNNR